MKIKALKTYMHYKNNVFPGELLKHSVDEVIEVSDEIAKRRIDSGLAIAYEQKVKGKVKTVEKERGKPEENKMATPEKLKKETKKRKKSSE